MVVLESLTTKIRSLLCMNGDSSAPVADSPPARSTREKLAKLISLADDDRGDIQTRRTAKRILARYAKHYPELVRVKK